jgi:zinc/manganese transport system permease protein
MFAGFMTNAWIVGTLVAIVAGMTGFFVVLRGSAFAAHAIPQSAFAGAAFASLVGIDTLTGLAAFSILGALGIALLGQRGRHDVATALTLVFMLSLGSLFLSMTDSYAQQVYALLFGEVLGISTNQVAPTAGIVGLCVAAIVILYRPLLITTVLPSAAETGRLTGPRLDLAFLLVLAAATTLTVPVVGTLLVFSLMIGPPAAARSFTNRPGIALILAMGISLVSVWTAIAASYTTDYPIGFYVGAISAAWYTAARIWTATRHRYPSALSALTATSRP